MGSARESRRLPFSLIAGSLFLLLAVTVLPSPIRASEPEGKEYLRHGRKALDEGHVAEAVLSLEAAVSAFPLLADYSLFYLAEARHGAGDHEKSYKTILDLLTQYPESPLKRKARLAQIREAREIEAADLPAIYERHCRDYPDDDDVAFQYAQLLRKNGEGAKARAILRKVYIASGPLAASALGDLGPEDITAADLAVKASNLMKRYDFDDAERILRKALASARDDQKTELLRNLGYALFKQKKYREAAEIYGRANDLFFRARSLYRSGDRQGFEEALRELERRNEQKAGSLLLAVAGDKRREKDFEAARKIAEEIAQRYPDDAAEALWQIGWTHFIAGEYEKAAAVFARLSGKDKDPRHVYWQARSGELAGLDTSDLYRKLLHLENNYYAALALVRLGGVLRHAVSQGTALSERTETPPRRFERTEALISIGLKKEAVWELTSETKKSLPPSEFLYAVSRFTDLGEYKRSVTLAAQAPYSEQMHRFWYPLAYWDTVEESAKRFEIDPFIILSVIREESRFDPSVKSPAGAYGLMQLMPSTAYRLDTAVKLNVRDIPRVCDVRNNILLGTYYLKTLFQEFPSLVHVLAAYNAGEAAVRSWQQRTNGRAVDEFVEDIPYAETRNYVKKVITSYVQYRRVAPSKVGGDDLAAVLGRL